MLDECMTTRRVIVILLLLSPEAAIASDPTPILFALVVHILSLAWPLVVPLFFLKNSEKKLKTYLLFLLIVYGVIGIISLPLDIYMNASAWLSLPLDLIRNKVLVMAKIILSISVSVIVLRMLSGKLAQVFND